jgi:hypothetical protein
MRPMSKTYIAGVVFAVSLFLFSVAGAFADSYSVNVVRFSQSESFYGIDSAGDFVVNISDTVQGSKGGCGTVLGASQCFASYYMGQQDPFYSTTAPNLSYDDGSACSEGGLSGICNNGQELLSGTLGGKSGVWSGTNAATDFLSTGSFDGGFINKVGDAVFIDGANDTLVSVVDLSTAPTFHVGADKSLVFDGPTPAPVPEPESLVLVGTGLLAVAGTMRRRLVR